MTTKFKVLKAGVDFQRTFSINPKIDEKFLIKSCIATGWGKLVKVIRVMKTQVEVEVINVVPTEETNRFGTKNGFKDRREGFFKDWAWRKKVNVGRKEKFFKDTCVMVGMTEDWNPSILVKLI